MCIFIYNLWLSLYFSYLRVLAVISNTTVNGALILRVVPEMNSVLFGR